MSPVAWSLQSTPRTVSTMPTSSRFQQSVRRGSGQSHPCHRGYVEDVTNDAHSTHGSSIRALLNYLEDVVGDVIPDLEFPRGTPVVYELDADLKPFLNEFLSRLMAIPSVPW